MRRSKAAIALAACLLLPLAADAQFIGPAVTNNYSYIQSYMPNYGIAQGSIFTIMGAPKTLAPSIASQTVPLATTLAGVAVTVTVGGVTVQAIPYYVSPDQITAILPSSTPVGAATFTVTSGGDSASAVATVVPTAFGLATFAAPSGPVLPWLPALAQNDSDGGLLVTQTKAANAGEYLTLWGSGLGPVSGNETQYQAPVNLTNIPIQVLIGGQSATVTYRGRSVYPGLDQINVIVPSGVSGCSVSVVVTAGGIPSNFATIPIASSGRMCADPVLMPITSSSYQTLLGRGTVNAGSISVTSLSAVGSAAAASASDSAYASFQTFAAQQVSAGALLQMPSIGSCLVTDDGKWSPPVLPSTGQAQLNAGPQLNVSGPDGVLSLPEGPAGSYFKPAGTSPPIVPPTGGAVAFDNGSGGTDVGAFKVSLTGSLTAPLAWSSGQMDSPISRTQDLPITWSGGFPGGFVYIVGTSSMSIASPLANGSTVYFQFICTAAASAGRLVVPAAALESLPPAANGSLYVASGLIQPFSAVGLDVGLLFLGVGGMAQVAFN